MTRSCLQLLAVYSFLLLATANAQTVTGSIVGTVQDASGSPVQGAVVLVTNEGTNAEFRALTDSSGGFSAPVLPSGNYTLKVEMAGFRSSVAKGVTLLANRTVRQDFTLEVGQVQQSVEVNAAAPVVNSENATIGNVMQSRQITTLPLNGRMLDRLIRISAGVTTDSASNPRVAGSSYWGGVQFNVDGAAFNDPGNGGGAYSYRHGMATLPSVDTVAEFKMDSNNQKAEYEGASSVTVVTRSGTNEVHGSIFEFNRNKAYTARNFFAPTNPPFNRNEFGFTAGGPIVRDRTFFFGGYEGLRERSSNTYNLSVATAAQRAGNFSGLRTIIDPLSGAPFSNNQIPADRIDSRARALLERVQLPNGAGTGAAGTINNLFVNVPNKFNIDRYFLRIDHHFSSKDQLSGNFNSSKGDPYFVAQGFPIGYGSWENGGFDTKVWNLTWNRNFSATILNEARFGYLYHGSMRLGMNTDFNPRTLFPSLADQLPVGGLPNVNINNHVSIGDYGGSERGKQFTRQIVDNITFILGKHTFKTGVNISNFRVSSPPAAFGLLSGAAQNATFGRFDFTGRFSSGGTAAGPEHALADFLLGYPNTTYRSSPSAVNLFYNTTYAGYAQDDYRVSSRFTLTYGVRYFLQTTWKERDRAQANFDFATGRLVIPRSDLPQQAQARLVAAYPIVTDPNFEIMRADTNNFAPRIGFAFRPFNDNKTVIRGGAGFYYNMLPVYIGFRQMGFSNPPFLLSETFESAPGSVPSLTLANPFPGAGAVSPNPSITAVETQMKNSLSQQWNLTVEREIAGNLGLRASYVGNKTSNLPFYNDNINLSRQQIGGPLQPNRPYQPWSDINYLHYAGDSTLHQLQLEAIKRYSNGLNFQLEYSWNRSLDNTPIVGGPQDPYNASADRGNSDQIRRHIFSAAYAYELPFGPGRPLLSNIRGVGGKIIGGWGVAGITYLRTGQPFSVTFNSSVQGWRNSRADVTRTGELSRDERSITRWFDPSGYFIPAQFAFGNSARNHLFGPGDIVFDVSFIKDTPITERINTQFRAEFFNLPNHANFGNPGANLSNPASLGRITSAGDPRQIQFGLKVLF